MVRRSPTGACQCARVLASPRNPRSSRLGTSTPSSTPSSPASARSSCSWQLPGQPPSTHSRSPQTVDTDRPWAVWVCRLASQEHLLVGPGPGALHAGGEPVHADCLAGAGHLPKQFAQVVQGGDAGAVGLAEPERAKRAEQQVQAVADLGLGDPDRPAGAPVRQHGGQTSRQASATCRWSGPRQCQGTRSITDTLSEIGHYDVESPNQGSFWAAYWYNGFIYGSDIPNGFDSFLFSGPQRAGAQRLGHLNPQPQETYLRERTKAEARAGEIPFENCWVPRSRRAVRYYRWVCGHANPRAKALTHAMALLGRFNGRLLPAWPSLSRSLSVTAFSVAFGSPHCAGGRGRAPANTPSRPAPRKRPCGFSR